MHAKDTPPSSPNFAGIMDDEEGDQEEDLYEDEMVSVSDGEEVNLVEVEEEDEEEGSQPTRDDAKFVFSNHKGSVFCCHIEPTSGTLAVTGGEDDRGCVWNMNTGEIVLECKGHKDSVTCVEFSYDGTYVATGDMCGVVQVWKISNRSLVWETNVGDLEWLHWHHGANVLLGGTISGEIYMWRIPGGQCKVFPGSSKKTECGLILPDGKRTAVGYEDGSIKVYDMKNVGVLHHIAEGQAHSDALTDMDCHPDNNLLLTSSVDGRAVVLTTQTGRIVSVLDCRENTEDEAVSGPSVEAVGFYADSSLAIAATGTLNGSLGVWDISKGVQRHKTKLESGITKLLWEKSRPVIYAATLDGSIGVFDGRSGLLEKQFLGHSNGILDFSLSTVTNVLLSTSYDSTARIFSI